MLVHGGRSWLRVGSVAGFVASAVLLNLAACGSRTSMLDQEAYTTGFGTGGDRSVEPPTLGNTGKPSAAGNGVGAKPGSSGTGGAGAPGKPTPTTGGKGGGTGLDPNSATTPCKQYCPGYSTDCANKLKPGQDCVASCEGEINGSGAACQKLGIAALNCLTPFFQPGLSCDVAINQGLGKCGQLVSAFQTCTGPTTTPTMPGQPPTPTPVPMPTPNPPFGCIVNALSIDPSNCKAALTCSSGAVEIFCTPTPQPNIKNCGCLGPNGQMVSAAFMDTPDVCLLAAEQLCRFP